MKTTNTAGGTIPQEKSANFSFLAVYDVQLVRLGALAERYFKEDPATSLIKLRQYGEALAQLVAAKAALFRDTQEPQSDLLRRLRFERVIPQEVADLFHHLRILGNKATHENEGTHAEALTGIKVAREMGIWFHRTFGTQKSFSPGAFVPPPDPAAATHALTVELARLRSEVDQHRTTAEKPLGFNALWPAWLTGMWLTLSRLDSCKGVDYKGLRWPDLRCSPMAALQVFIEDKGMDR